MHINMPGMCAGRIISTAKTTCTKMLNKSLGIYACMVINDIMYHIVWISMNNPDSKVHGANMGPSWVLSAPTGPHVGPMNFVIGEGPLESRSMYNMAAVIHSAKTPLIAIGSGRKGTHCIKGNRTHERAITGLLPLTLRCIVTSW